MEEINTERLTLALAAESDLPELEAIEKEEDEYFSFDTKCNLNHSISIRECLAMGDVPPGGKRENYYLYCVRQDNILIGYASYYLEYPESHTAYISVLYVKESHRMEGIGAEVLEALIQRFKSLGMKEARLHCSLRNAIALCFWVKNGFNRIVGIECNGNLFPENFGGLELLKEI